MIRRTLFLLISLLMVIPFILELFIKLYLVIPIYRSVTGKWVNMGLITGEIMEACEEWLIKKPQE